MKIYAEKSLRDFEFWSGAMFTYDALTCDELDQIESVLEELYPEGIDETHLNDLFWFETDWIAEILGYEDWEALEADRDDPHEA